MNNNKKQINERQLSKIFNNKSGLKSRYKNMVTFNGYFVLDYYFPYKTKSFCEKLVQMEQDERLPELKKQATPIEHTDVLVNTNLICTEEGAEFCIFFNKIYNEYVYFDKKYLDIIDIDQVVSIKSGKLLAPAEFIGTDFSLLLCPVRVKKHSLYLEAWGKSDIK